MYWQAHGEKKDDKIVHFTKDMLYDVFIDQCIYLYGVIFNERATDINRSSSYFMKFLLFRSLMANESTICIIFNFSCPTGSTLRIEKFMRRKYE